MTRAMLTPPSLADGGIAPAETTHRELSSTLETRAWLPSVMDRWCELRNQVLASPKFQRWAARFPFTRRIARRRASTLFDLCTGFVYSQVLLCVVELRLLETLAERPLSIDEIARRTDLPAASSERLVHAAVALGLVEPRRPTTMGVATYGLGQHGASFLGNPGVREMVLHHRLLYRDLVDPVALLRREGPPATELSRFWSYVGGPAGHEQARDAASYSALMASSLSLIAEDILEAYPQRRHTSLLDVGGGEGAFLEAVSKSAPHLDLALFELPAVAQRARERLARAALFPPPRVVEGDVLRDPLPRGADLISLVRVIHDHDDPDALRILRAVRAALTSGGVVLVAEPMAGTKHVEAMGDAYFGFYLLAMGQGRPRTAARLREIMIEAGFAGVELRKTRRPLLSQLMIGRVP